MNIVDLIIYVSLSAINVTLLILLMISWVSRRKIFASLVQENIDKNLILSRLSQVTNENEALKIEQSEGFVRFLSESRQSAFDYIEQVQDALQDFDLQMSPIIEWSNTYGIVNGDNAHTEALEKISLAYDKLRSVLPEEDKKPNN
jgi:hypothetical protein